MRRFLPVTVAGLSLLLAVGVAPAALAEPPDGVELVADGGFDSALQFRPTVWQCEPNAGPVALFPQPGADFLHLVPPNDPQVPGVLGPASGADFLHGGPVPTAVGHTPAPRPTAPGADFLHSVPPPAGPSAGLATLIGTPGAMQLAECAQTVPVRANASYTLTARVRGGMAFLGTEHGVVWAPPSAEWTTLSTTFTTGPDARSVRVFVRGWYGGARYEADDVSLRGPVSDSMRPAAPTALRVDRRTSTSMLLSWSPVPGARSYEVRHANGRVLATVTRPSAGIRPLPAGTFGVTVTARTDAGPSEPATVQVPAAPEHRIVPETPRWVGVTATSHGGRRGFLIRVVPGERTTDGYAVYLNGGLVGWLPGGQGFVPVGAPGTYQVQVSGLNSAGQSMRTAAQPGVVPTS